MVITILEGRVPNDKQEILKSTYSDAVSKLDPGIVETFLIEDSKDHNLWRIMTVWKDQETLNAVRNSGETPKGVLIFREAEVVPGLSIQKVINYARA